MYPILSVALDQSPGTVKSSPLITVHSAYLPSLVALVLLSTKTKEPLGVVTWSIQSDWFVNVVSLVVPL